MRTTDQSAIRDLRLLARDTGRSFTSPERELFNYAADRIETLISSLRTVRDIARSIADAVTPKDDNG